MPAPFSIAFPGCTISTLIINAGTFGNGFAFIGQAASPRTLSFYTTLAAGTNWTASGQKGVYLNSWYITNE